MLVQDSPGVLAQIAACFATHDVSIQVVRQVPSGPEQAAEARLGVLTHTAGDVQLRATVADLEAMPAVEAGIRVMRVEGE